MPRLSVKLKNIRKNRSLKLLLGKRFSKIYALPKHKKTRSSRQIKASRRFEQLIESHQQRSRVLGSKIDRLSSVICLVFNLLST